MAYYNMAGYKNISGVISISACDTCMDYTLPYSYPIVVMDSKRIVRPEKKIHTSKYVYIYIQYYV